jgi:hypothetical protein
MTPVTGIVRNGKIEIVAPTQYSEGAKVRLWLDAEKESDDGPVGEEEIRRTLDAFDRFSQEFPPDENGEDLSQAARENAEWEKSNFETRARKLRGLFE